MVKRERTLLSLAIYIFLSSNFARFPHIIAHYFLSLTLLGKLVCHMRSSARDGADSGGLVCRTRPAAVTLGEQPILS